MAEVSAIKPSAAAKAAAIVHLGRGSRVLCSLTAAILIATCVSAAQDLPTHAKEPLDYSCRDEP